MIWLEIRCERRGTREYEKYSDNNCWSDSNSGPFSEAYPETQANIANASRHIIEQAKSAGWKKITGEGWVCPNCKSK